MQQWRIVQRDVDEGGMSGVLCGMCHLFFNYGFICVLQVFIAI